LQAKVSSAVQIEAQRKALSAALRLESVMSKTGSNPVQQILQASGEFFEWRDYPDGGVWDRDTGYGYFYHAHPGPAFPDEHGHFHLFWARDLGARVNLAALSMDRLGRAMGVFVPNLWHVPFETDPACLQHYQSFDVALAFPCFAANQWLGAAVRAFAPQLAAVHRAAIAAAGDSATVNDRSRWVLTAKPGRLDAQILVQTGPKIAASARRT
jgi:hypothetical protein